MNIYLRSLPAVMALAMSAAANVAVAQNTGFDGTLDCNKNRYMTIDQSDAFNVAAGNGEITVTARVWIRDNYFGKARGIICSRYHETHTLAVWYYYGSGFDIHGGESAAHCFSNNVTVDGSHEIGVLGCLKHTYDATAGKIEPGAWHHIAWTFKSEGGVSTIYIDGEQVETTTEAKEGKKPAGEAITDRGNILVGGRYKWGNQKGLVFETRIDEDAIWDGKIDDVRFYRNALDAADIKRDCESGFPLADKTLIAAYDFENIEGNKVTDISGNGHTGTLVVVKGDNFPAAEKSCSLTAVAPEADGVTLTLEGSVDGQVPVSATTSAGNENATYAVSNMADYRFSYAIDPDKFDSNLYECLGAFVNGQHAEPGTFLKADGNTTVEVRFRERPYNFTLVHYNTEDGQTYTYPFTRSDADIHRHAVTTPHSKTNHFYGHFYVTGDLEGVEQTNALAEGSHLTPAHVELYADPARQLEYEGSQVVNLPPSEEAVLFGKNEGVMFTSHNAGDVAGLNSGYAAEPTFHLVYEPAENGAKTLMVELENGGVQTGIEDVAADADKAEYYNLNGTAVSADALQPGLYIMRRGGTCRKVTVR